MSELIGLGDADVQGNKLIPEENQQQETTNNAKPIDQHVDNIAVKGVSLDSLGFLDFL